MTDGGPNSNQLQLDSHRNPALFWTMAYKVSDAIMALEQFGVLSELAVVPASSEELAERCGLSAGPLSCVLTLLATANVIEQIGTRFSLPAGTRAALPAIRLESQTRNWHAANGSLVAMLKNCAGSDPFQSMDREEDSLSLQDYQEAMASTARALASHFFRHAKLSGEITVVDIGGSDGALAGYLAKLLLSAQFTVIDLPRSRSGFDRRTAVTGSSLRMRFVADDVTRPDHLVHEVAKADLAIMSNLLHLLPKDQIENLIALLRTNLKPGAKVAIYDQFLHLGQLGIANLMVIDWICVGSQFDLDSTAMVRLLGHAGFVDVISKQIPGIPGAIVIGVVP